MINRVKGRPVQAEKSSSQTESRLVYYYDLLRATRNTIELKRSESVLVENQAYAHHGVCGVPSSTLSFCGLIDVDIVVKYS